MTDRRLGEFNETIQTPKRQNALSKLDFPASYENEPGICDALAAINGRSPVVFVLGRAGTGKTTLIHFLSHKIGSENQVILAPTGIAALNVGGQTIHSFFRIPPRLIDLNSFEPAKPRKVWRAIKRVIIDEVSMVRADLLDAVDIVLRNARNSDDPFGGVQIVLVGDFLQLPPVTPNDHLDMLHQIGYASPYAFSAFALADTSAKVIHLPTVHRQSDPSFVDLLSNIRSSNEIDDALSVLNSRCFRKHRSGVEPMLLTGTNAQADKYNRSAMDALSTSPRTYAARIRGKFDAQKGRLPVPETLELKTDARVMAVKNDSQGRWVNGSIGTATDVEKTGVWVRFDGLSSAVLVEAQSWENVRYEWNERTKRVVAEVIGTYTQIPLIPAWATTIHKAQGLTLDDVRVDLQGGAFASGQSYVAISRARSVDGLSLTKPLTRADVFVDPLLLKFESWSQLE